MALMDHIKRVIKHVEQYIKNGNWNSAKLRLEHAVKFYRMARYHPDLSDKLFLAHYTSMDALKSIIESNTMRLYAADSLNDPNEGDYLRQNLSAEYPFLKGDSLRDGAAFICSFVGGGDQDIANKLGYWQSYGEDGLGCSIQPTSHPIQRPLRFRLAKVRYGECGMKEMQETFRPCLDAARDCFQTIDECSTTHFWHWFRECLSGIAYLHKSDDYKSEEEYRIVVTSKGTSRGYIKPYYDYKNDPGEGPRVRKFIKGPAFRPFMATGSKIVIGPRVQDTERIIEYLEALCHKRGQNLDFSPSRIDYRKFW